MALLFRRQHPIGPYIVDFACHSARLIVEVDGEIHNQQQEYDAERDDCLRQLGFTVMRVTIDRVLTDLNGVLREIQNACAAPPLPRTGEGAGGGGSPADDWR
jgi:5-methyltetrahydrofolate--homocysteine methyltransferase